MTDHDACYTVTVTNVRGYARWTRWYLRRLGLRVTHLERDGGTWMRPTLVFQVSGSEEATGRGVAWVRRFDKEPT